MDKLRRLCAYSYWVLNRVELDKDQVKAAIKAQQDQQIDNALLAEGRFYSDLELTEKEIERMVMEASRAEYVSNDKFRQQLGCRESSTSVLNHHHRELGHQEVRHDMKAVKRSLVTASRLCCRWDLATHKR
ncbi:hypothetical protein RND71_042224 [Anisodus tanguticus]|uniref:Uncharacterized protein n=1 Tax=Anisodus tanguticus TaxID=243964 RepID=A0AAE1QT37_9SOLA|nr:hypothetical protein RND71_042224 [Anisodus tanguticus]